MLLVRVGLGGLEIVQRESTAPSSKNHDEKSEVCAVSWWPGQSWKKSPTCKMALANCWALGIGGELCHVIAVFYDLELGISV